MKIGDLRFAEVLRVRNEFWKRVNKTGKCWVWCGGKTKKYGKIRIDGRHTYAHRFSYCLHTKKDLIGVCVLHSCDNPICVNPEHLFKGSQPANVADRDNKGRQAKGEMNARSKLDSQSVLEIRRRYKPRCKKNGQEALAKEFGVATLAIRCVVSRKTWRHI